LTHARFALIRFELTVFGIFSPADQYHLCYGRSNKIGVNWFPYLQTLLPKFHDVEEQRPPECWAVAVIVLEPWWPWQISQVFFSLDYHFLFELMLWWTTL
jgi:hypothetical protein